MTGDAPLGIGIHGTLSFGDGHHVPVNDFELEPGGWTCLLGPSGVGKSTLLRWIAGLPVAGVFEGTFATSDAAPLTDRIAYMAQSDLLASWLNVRDNVALGARLRGETLDPGRCADLIEKVGLTRHQEKFPPELSGGMRQRVALARTLMEDRPLALLDEPFSALDARTRSEMQELAFEMLAERTVLIVTHDPAEAVRLGDRVYLMESTGITPIDVPGTQTIRKIDDPECLSAQARLLLNLRRVQ